MADGSTADQSAELVDALFTFMPMVAKHVNDHLAQFEMTTTDYWALRNIEGPMPMKDLATAGGFDPSYVTVVADHLEELGLIERQPHPTDRRIKNLVLTQKGHRRRKAIAALLWDGPNPFSSLTDTQRSRLHDLVSQLAAANSGGDGWTDRHD